MLTKICSKTNITIIVIDRVLKSAKHQECLPEPAGSTISSPGSSKSKFSVFNKSDLFCKMFPDSKIAENFSCGKTKRTYIVCFGLTPYSKGLLTKRLSNVEHILALSMNLLTKHKSMVRWTCMFVIGAIITTT